MDDLSYKFLTCWMTFMVVFSVIQFITVVRHPAADLGNKLMAAAASITVLAMWFFVVLT